MQSTFTPIDHFKISWVLEEALQKLNFLSKISREDGASSELAEYEINKSLAEQAHLEAKYAELLKVRTTLKGISNKRKLEEIQQEIQEIAHNLKENTKKLGRLFRENPSFEKDAEKVNNQKAELMVKLEGIINVSSQSFSFPNIQAALIDELEVQDYLRKQNLKEQALVQDVKQLHAIWKKEEEEFQNLVVEKEAHIQRQKENLARHQSDALMEKKYKENELYAKEGTTQRLQGQRIQDLQKQIEEAQGKKTVEIIAFQKVSGFLKSKEEATKEKTKEWAQKLESSRETLDMKIENLNNVKAKALDKLDKLKKQYEKEDAKRKDKEKQKLEQEEAKQKRIDEENKVDEAIKAIQEAFQAWKEGGGTVKKSKKSKGKKEGKSKKG